MALRIPTLRNRTRPAGRPMFETVRPPQQKPDFDVLFDDLLETRRLYEDLRLIGAPAYERIDARERLHALRASIAKERPGLL